VIKQDGKKIRLLDTVAVITGVSGGSFTALAYGLYGDRLFAEYEQRFLKRDVQGELIARFLNPLRWGNLSFTEWGRSELAADIYDEILFNGATFADLTAGRICWCWRRPPTSRPAPGWTSARNNLTRSAPISTRFACRAPQQLRPQCRLRCRRSRSTITAVPATTRRPLPCRLRAKVSMLAQPRGRSARLTNGLPLPTAQAVLTFISSTAAWRTTWACEEC